MVSTQKKILWYDTIEVERIFVDVFSGRDFARDLAL